MEPMEMSNAQFMQIIRELEGADDVKELEICEKYGIDQSSVYNVMTSHGYTWEDRWVREEPGLW